METKPGIYRHFKGGEYAVRVVPEEATTGQRIVVYVPLYGDQPRPKWRTESEFHERVTRGGYDGPRFVWVRD